MSDPDVITRDLLHTLEQTGYINSTAQPSQKKSKKRARDGEDGEARIKKKKDRTERSSEVIEQDVTATETIVEEAKKKKKKKKKKDRGKQHVELTQQEVQAEHPASAPASHLTSGHDFTTSSADFLSAVVAAASATSLMNAGPSTEFTPSMMPYHDSMPQYPPATGDFPAFGPPPAFLAGADGAELPDLSLVSSDYLLQTLQNLDMTQIASVLKTIGDNAPSYVLPSLSIPPTFVAAPQPPGPPPVKQTSAKSVSILGRHPKQVKASGQSTRSLPPPTLPLPSAETEEDNPDHAYMLANVWMNAAKLGEMSKTHGLVYKKGKFSATEEAQLSAAMERYKSEKGMSQQDLVDLVFSKDKNRGETFWQEITSAVHARPIIAVYHHVRRKLDPLSSLGKWMASEDESLQNAVMEFGQQWQKVSERVGRSASDCRDRYRNHIENRDTRRSGFWSREEEEELTAIVTELKVQRGEVSDNDIFWGAVSQRMGGRRGRQQCRIKWLDSLSSKFKNDGAKPRWSQLDAYILVHKVDSLNVRDDTEIDWKNLPDEDWNMWSAHALQRRWLTMKRSIKGHEDMSHAELMDILRTKKAQSPPPATVPRGTKKHPRSAETIEDSEDDEQSAEAPAASVSPEDVSEPTKVP